MPHRCCALLLALLCLTPAVARAGAEAEPNPYLEQGRRLLRSLRYPEAVRQLEIARGMASLGEEERVEVLWLLAHGNVALGERAKAERSLLELLTLRPDFVAPAGASPKVREVFDEAKQGLYPRDYVKLEPLPALPTRPAVRLVDPWRQVDAVVLRFRASGGGWREAQGVRSGDRVSFELPASAEPATSWGVEARSASGAVLATQALGAVPPSALPAASSGAGPASGAPASRPGLSTRSRVALALAGVAVAAAGGGAVAQGLSLKHAREAAREEWVDTARELRARSFTEATWATGLFAGAAVSGAAAGVVWVW